jgi:hypothetical protein
MYCLFDNNMSMYIVCSSSVPIGHGIMVYRSSHVVYFLHFNLSRCHTIALIDHSKSLIPNLSVMVSFASSYIRHKSVYFSRQSILFGCVVVIFSIIVTYFPVDSPRQSVSHVSITELFSCCQVSILNVIFKSLVWDPYSNVQVGYSNTQFSVSHFLNMCTQWWRLFCCCLSWWSFVMFFLY